MFARRSAVLLLCLTLLLPACGPVPTSTEVGVTTGQSAAAEPTKRMTSEPFTIALISNDPNGSAQKKAQETMLDCIQRYANAQGWPVRIIVRKQEVPASNAAPEYDGAFEAIRKDIATGEPADGYQVSPELAKKLMDERLTQDAGALCRQSAPQLYDKLRVLQHEATGIPMCLIYWTKCRPTVLYLDKSILTAYNKPISNADDLMAFLEAGQHAIVYRVTDNYDIWAAQQGYYELGSYGLLYTFYARMDDPACTPVPLERIKGFEGAYRRMSTLGLQGKIIDDHGDLDSVGIDANICGYLGPLKRRVDSGFLQRTGKAAADYTVIALQGCTAPALVEDDPFIDAMLAVPAISQHGNAVAAFCQWALASPDGYGLMNYGKQDVDYRITDRGIEYLKGGAPLSTDDWKQYNALALPAMCTIQGTLFYSDALERANVYEADNVEELIQKTQPVLPPIWNITRLRGYGYSTGEPINDRPIYKKLGDMMSKYQDALSVWSGVLSAGDMEVGRTMSGDRIDEYLNQKLALLETVEVQMDQLTLNLKNLITSMMPQ